MKITYGADIASRKYIMRIEIDGNWVVLVDGQPVHDNPPYPVFEFDKQQEKNLIAWAKSFPEDKS